MYIIIVCVCMFRYQNLISKFEFRGTWLSLTYGGWGWMCVETSLGPELLIQRSQIEKLEEEEEEAEAPHIAGRIIPVEREQLKRDMGQS